MTRKEMVSAKIGGKTFDRLENYAEEEEISRSQAIDRMLKQGLDVEESDMRLIPVKADGGTVIEESLSETQQELSRQIDNRQSTQTYLNTIIVIAVLWFAMVSFFQTPPIAVITTGGGIVTALIYVYYKRWFNAE
jgi:hypothetical protein